MKKYILILLLLISNSIFSQTEEQKKHPKFPYLITHIKSYNALMRILDFENALKESEIILELGKEIFGKESSYTAGYYNNVGEVYNYKGEYDNALKYYEKALEIDLKTSGEWSSNTAISYDNIGHVYNKMGKHDQAIYNHKKALEIFLKTVGEEHADTKKCYNNLSNAYKDKGQEDLAQEYRKKEIGDKYEEYLLQSRYLAQLGNNYIKVQAYSKAIEVFKQSLEIKLMLLKENDEEIGSVQNNLGYSYKKLGDYPKALNLYFDSLKTSRKVFGQENSNTATILNNIGEVYIEIGDLEKSYEFHNEALKIRLKIFTKKDHPDLAQSYQNIGELFRRKGYYQEAIEFGKTALEIYKKAHGEQHKDISDVLNNIGLAYSEKGNYSEAIKYYSESIDLNNKYYKSENNLSTAITFHNLGLVYLSKGEKSKAFEYFNKSLDIKRKVVGEKSLEVAHSYDALGSFYLNQVDDNKALECFEKSLRIKKEIGIDSLSIARTYNDLFIVLSHKGDIKEAQKYIEAALDVANKLGEILYLATIYDNIASIYTMKGNYQLAIEYHTKSKNIKIKALGEKHTQVAQSDSYIALQYMFMNDNHNTMKYFDKSLSVFRNSNDRHNLILTLSMVKQFYKKIKKNDEEINTILEELVSNILKTRSEIVGKDKQQFTENYIHLFKELSSQYRKTNQTEKAFKISEKMRGLSILENFQLQFALKESKIEQNIIEEISNRKGQIESLYSVISNLLMKQDGKENKYIDSIRERLLKEERELEIIDYKLRQSNPVYARNREIIIPDISDLQKMLGNYEKTFIEFNIVRNSDGTESLTAFVIDKNKFEYEILGEKLSLSIDINNLRQIISRDPDARNLILGRTLDNHDYLFSLESNEYLCLYSDKKEKEKCDRFQKGTQVFREEWESESFQNIINQSKLRKKWKLFANMEKEISSDLATNQLLPLYSKKVYSIIVKPLYDKNSIRNNNILISPDSSIYTVPFSALITEDGNYWSEKANISMIHSASIWMKLKESKERTYSFPVYAMGNPVYSKENSSKKEVNSSTKKSFTKILNLEEIELDDLSDEELKFILKEIYKTQNSEHVKDRVSANKQELIDTFKERKPIYKTIHFSVHGLFFPDNESLNSLALTSRTKVKEIDPEALKEYENKTNKKVPEDGFLKLGDVIDLGLKTDLVIMSACETSLGTERAGEGMIGLPQAFLMAGAQNTIATLWQVDEAGTILFIYNYYNYYHLSTSQLNASESLRKAQIEMLSKKKRYNDPYYWAPFVIYGE